MTVPENVRFALGSPLGPLLIGLLCVALLFWLVVDIGHMLERIRQPQRRALLLVLRLLTAACAAALLFQPQWLLERVQEGQGRVAVLMDVSRSMSLQDGTEHSRAAEALEVLQRLTDSIPDLAVFTFGSELQPTTADELVAHYPTQADQTRIGPALTEATRAMGPELGALILVSDGADSSGDLPKTLMRELRSRVHVVALGGKGPKQDDAIVEVRADPVAFLRQQAEVEVSVQRTPPAPGTLQVSLRSGGEVLREVTALLNEQGKGRVVIPFEVSSLGRAAYTVSIPVPTHDGVPQNNERAFLMRVKRDRLRVLLVCGRPGWDARFLRAFLKDNPSIDLITFFILRTANDMSMAAPDELSLIPFPTDELFREHLDSFDLVLFQDFNYGPYQMARYLPRVRDYVNQGGSFAMLGGELSFSAGGYANTPVADILPVTLPDGEAQDTLSPAPFHPLVQEDMLAHPLVELLPSASENARRWSELAPLQGSNWLEPPRPGSSTLLVHPRLQTSTGEPRPILVVGSAGRGRTMALASDSSYRWGMTTAGKTGDPSTYDRFWDRALRWLTRDPLLEAAQVHTDQERYGPAGAITADYLLRDERYRPAAAVDVKAEVLDGKGNVLAHSKGFSDSSGRGELQLHAPEAPGAYRLQVSGPSGTSAEEVFVVEAGGQELSHPFPDPRLLGRLAKQTDGELYTPETLDPDGLPRSKTRSLGVEREQPLAQPAFLGLAALLWLAEWVLRRRWGLR